MSGLKGSPAYACSAAFQSAMARYRNDLVQQSERSGRTLAIRWERQDAQADAASQSFAPESRNHFSLRFVDVLSAINIMDMGLQSEPEAATFVATTEQHETPADLQAPTAMSTNDGQIYARIRAFENAQISRDAFVEYLKTLQVDALTDLVQKRIVQAIERFERAAAEGSGRKPPSPMEQGPVEQGPVEQGNVPGTPSFATAKSITPRKQTKAEARAPASERILANVEKVLGLKAHAIDGDRPFQDCGLDSILAVRLASALEKEFGCTITPGWLVEHSTLNALTQRLDRDLNELELAS
jgi:acyl carrier protein